MGTPHEQDGRTFGGDKDFFGGKELVGDGPVQPIFLMLTSSPSGS